MMPVDTGRLGLPKLDHVHCCQWRALLRLLPEQSVDLLLTDMPYNTTAVSWDKYVVPLDAFWRHVKRVMKPRGAVVLTGSQPFTSKLVMSNEAWFRYNLVWNKKFAGNFSLATIRPMITHEDVCIFSNTATLYNPQMTKRDAPIKAGGMVNSKTTGTNYSALHKEYEFKYPVSILHFPRDLGRTIHPTQKPVALFEYLIRTYTNPGAIVVDPFVGSGTTAVAAANTGRHFIVGDISQEYVDIARWRLSTDFGTQRPTKQTAPLDDLPLFGGAMEGQHD